MPASVTAENARRKMKRTISPAEIFLMMDAPPNRQNIPRRPTEEGIQRFQSKTGFRPDRDQQEDLISCA
jgi:hypothetical protein